MPLVFVPTPLGNLRDVTLRALEILRAADAVVAEDTRVARRLLGALDIGSKPLVSYREQNAAAVTDGILQQAREQLVAVVTDAACPASRTPARTWSPRRAPPASRSKSCRARARSWASPSSPAFRSGGSPSKAFRREPRARGTPNSRGRSQPASRPSGSNRPNALRPRSATWAPWPPPRGLSRARVHQLHEQQATGTPDAVAAQLTTLRGEIAFAVAPCTLERAETTKPAQAEEVDAAIDGLLDDGRSVSEIAKALAARSLGRRSDSIASPATETQPRQGRGLRRTKHPD